MNKNLSDFTSLAKKMQYDGLLCLNACYDALFNENVSALVNIALIASSIPNRIFLGKFSLFLEGLNAYDKNTRLKFAAKLTESANKRESALRIIKCIENAQDLKIVKFLINASRCFAAGFITSSDYFRICNIVVSTLEEDLNFLAKHIKETDLEYSYEVQGLINSGLMFQSVLNANVFDDSGHRYSFTPFAELVDKYSISYNDTNKYSMVNPQGTNNTSNNNTTVKLPTIFNSEINDIVKS